MRRDDPSRVQRGAVGWHTKSSASVNTRRLLVEHRGFLYDSDAYNDDAPYYVQVAGQPHLVLPYAFDTNDMRFFDGYAFVRGSDFAGYVIDAFDGCGRKARGSRRCSQSGSTRGLSAARRASAASSRRCSTCKRRVEPGLRAARTSRATGSKRCL